MPDCLLRSANNVAAFKVNCDEAVEGSPDFSGVHGGLDEVEGLGFTQVLGETGTAVRNP
jgi:hypothetical protein